MTIENRWRLLVIRYLYLILERLALGHDTCLYNKVNDEYLNVVEGLINDQAT